MDKVHLGAYRILIPLLSYLQRREPLCWSEQGNGPQ